MTMKSLVLAAVILLSSTFVNAQIYQWKDANGKTVISDKPPTGQVSDQRKIEARTPLVGESSQKTLADREMDFRKRQQESQEKFDKTRKEGDAAAEKKESCERLRRNLELLESGERVAQRDEKGERSFMEDAQREREIAKVRQTLQSSCK
jgi:hypothetical protein